VVARATTQGRPYEDISMSDLFFDLETQRSIQEVGGRDASRFKLLRVSVAVTLSAATNEFKSYTEKDVPALIADLKTASRVIGFNLKNFDYQVLKAYTAERLSDLPTLDLLEDLYNKLGFRIGLDALASATLGVNKSADGLRAIRWFREGKIDELIAYCRDDVAITQKLFEFGRVNRFVAFVDKYNRKQKVNVNWQ
jgi:DEAD/DEAH box helicase domain-containing protein